MAGTETSIFDLVAIGSGPAGQAAALQAAQLGLRVAVVERAPEPGGLTVSGAIPSKTMRAAVVEVTARLAGGYADARAEHDVTMDDLTWRVQRVVEHERETARNTLRQHGVTLIEGTATFLDPHTFSIRGGAVQRRIRADKIVIASGTSAARPKDFMFDHDTVVDTDGFLGLRSFPETLTVIGGGVAGLEYASMAAALGTSVTLVEARPRLLEFVDQEIVEALQYHLRGLGVVFRLGEEALAARRHSAGGAVVHLERGVELRSDVALVSVGRQGAVGELDLPAAGLAADVSGRLHVGPDYRTAQSHIFAAGDIAGRTGLAASAIEQGRQAALAACWLWTRQSPRAVPCGIFTLPEISFVGAGERELMAAGVPCAVGIARFGDLARGEIAGDRAGLLKLVADAETRELLGVHIFGTGATELVHIGQLAMRGGLTLDDLAETTFNVPTFSEAYRLAARDAVGRLLALDRALAA